MDHPARWIADQVGIRGPVHGHGFSGYPICHQRLEEETGNLFLPLLVASEIMSGGYGFEEMNSFQMAGRKFQKKMRRFVRPQRPETGYDLEKRFYD